MKLVNTFLVALCRTIIAGAFWLSIRLGNSLTIRGVKHDAGMPRTYLGMTHKRDIDPFVLVPIIVFHRGWKGLANEVHFALRADGFTRGFLARMIDHPRWLARLFRPLGVGPALSWLGTYPSEGLVRPIEEWIREVKQIYGDVEAGTVLSPVFLQAFARSTHLPADQIHAYPLSRLLAWRNFTTLRKFRGPEMLLATKRRPVERRVVERIHTQLDEIVACLWRDGSFLGSPEGQLSPGGRVSPLHAGFHRIVRAAPPDLRVVLIALNYDFMTSGRPHIFVNFTPAIEQAPGLPLDELDDRVRRSWLLAAHFTCSQLASGFLMERRCQLSTEFTLHELAHTIHLHAQKLAASGRHVDAQLLRLSSATRKARRYLAYVERRGLVQRCSRDCWKTSFGEMVIDVGPREVAYDDVPLLYAYNELQDLLSVS